MEELKIQTVVGLIKSAPIRDKSRKYSSKGVRHSNIRSTGIFAQKTFDGIIIGYWNVQPYRQESALAQLAQFVEYATANGYKLTQRNQLTYQIELAK